ncbi:MAG: TIGR01244 family sulfur transferase [Aestuariivita sp.]|nr:TIGR01244 family sulfur transferase [Aestuariivita sp.]MCY4203898.1 TIGR01244 family sulfur transferase [Aestuariivita sp.]MCY4345550.1 TIGR01244 family sulfur transferase [Aestuariivita sp.]
MTFSYINEKYAVSPQLEIKDLPAITAAGFTRIICNRPDEEVAEPQKAQVFRLEAEKVGIEFFELPLVYGNMTPTKVNEQRTLIEQANGSVLAYCASGTRSTVIWALGEAASGIEVSETLSATQRAGYDLTKMRETLQCAFDAGQKS